MSSHDNSGVHIGHCCKQHGCKYSDDDCPVEAGTVEQEFPCEYCEPSLPIPLDSIPVFCDDNVPQFDEETGQMVMWRIPRDDGTYEIRIHPDNQESMMKTLGRSYS